MSYLQKRLEQKNFGIKKESAEKKVYRLKKSPVKKISSKREAENEIYFQNREVFLKTGNGLCELKVPGVCTTKATCIHHVAGREGKKFLDQGGWKRSCHACNSWVEANDSAAREMGLKKQRNTKSDKRVSPKTSPD